ncbi:MAG: hypothetical protein ABSE64_15445 [Vulcanimicrobiaceae bacterium]|jgi:hypothetical protein
MAQTKTDLYTEHMVATEEREKPQRRTQTTRDHEVIRKWAKDRGAQPACNVRSDNTDTGVLRLYFSEQQGRPLRRIDWDEWFRAFDERELCFVYQDTSDDGKRSNFFRLELSG